MGNHDDGDAPGYLPDVYEQLRRLARARMGGGAGPCTLQPTAVVHEAYLRLADRSKGAWNDRSHFFAVAARAMRHVLVDHARGRGALKRGGDRGRVTLVTSDGAQEEGLDVLDLDRALVRLAESHERQARVVELKFFSGLTIPEIAEFLDVSHMTVSNDWRKARVWLARELGAG